MENKLRLGIPDGSMIDARRGGLQDLLERARIYIKNLDGKAKPEVINIPWLDVVMQRPQELPYLAAKGYCDAFFCGDDWVTEWRKRGYRSLKLLGLGIGKVSVVVGTKPRNKRWNIAASEYPFIAKDYLEVYKGAKNVQIVKYGEKIKGKYAVIESLGKTELKVTYQIADFVIESAQTGSSLEGLGLVVYRELFNSECGLFFNDSMSNDWKLNKLDRIAMMLKGAINAYDKELVTFNISNEKLEQVLDYIRKNRLFAAEETVIRGAKTSEITLELSVSGKTTDQFDQFGIAKKYPLIDVIGDLRDLGAGAIEGIPLGYSVRGKPTGPMANSPLLGWGK